MSVTASTSSPPLATLITVALTKGDAVQWEKKTELKSGAASITGDLAVARVLARLAKGSGLSGSDPVQRTEVDAWVDFCARQLNTKAEKAAVLGYLATLDKHLSKRQFFIGNKSITLADVVVFAAVQANVHARTGAADFTNLSRWLSYCSQLPAFKTSLAECETRAPTKTRTKDQGKFVELPGAQKGKVVVRFPPEASGYLHIGHAKAALINQYMQQHWEGALLMRFDDTNPAKENAEFEKVILEDLELLQVKWDKFSHTSDHFDLMLEYAEKLIKAGNAFCDDTPAEEMATERKAMKKSANRDNSIEKNMKMWEEMKKASDSGVKTCLRVKINFADTNGAMRDPVIYRCKPEEHVRTGFKYKVYPTYDFACPIVDSIEGVTHALRTTEYHDRDPQYYKICDLLEIRKPQIWDFSRLNLIFTVMSKRQLTWFVESPKLPDINSWSDPRFPTVRGILRRGLTIEGLRNFIISQGSSKATVQMEWDKIWSINKRVIDPVAERHTALTTEGLVSATVLGISKTEASTAPFHPKNPDIGTKTVYRSSKIFLETEDAMAMQEGDRVTLMDWSNAIVKQVKRVGNTVTDITLEITPKDTNYKGTAKLSWLADCEEEELVDITAVEYEPLITVKYIPKGGNIEDYVNWNSKFSMPMKGSATLAKLKLGDIIQVNRKGFFICDQEFVRGIRNLVLIFIPDGSVKGMNRGAKVQAADATTIAAAKADIARQSENVLSLKTGKAEKEDVRAAEAKLRAMKLRLKQLEGTADASSPAAAPAKQAESKAAASAPAPAATNAASSPEAAAIVQTVAELGAKIREMKAAKASKDEFMPFVLEMNAAKANYKELTGEDFPAPAGSGSSSKKSKKKKKAEAAPAAAPTPVAAAAPAAASGAANPEAQAIVAKVTELGDKIRQLKSEKAAKDTFMPLVEEMKAAKEEYKKLTGEDYPAPQSSRGKGKSGKSDKQQQQKQKQAKQAKKAAVPEKGKTRKGLEAKKAEDLPNWYSQVITKSELIEYYDVSGCYILRPAAYSIWEQVQNFFDAEIKKLGVENCYFPLFVSQAALEKEKDHIEDFAPEVAWVTKSGQSELAQPIAIRPTSETVMYPAFGKWIKSHRDLPMKLNQWVNVVRWEFKQPTPFLRTREFLWQEGHTAFAKKEEADTEVMQILDLYRRVYEELMAVPVVPGRKTEKEKFAGGDYTTTVEAYIPAAGRAIQGATSHHLGQNFSKMFDIEFEVIDKDGKPAKQKVFQNSWGLTTRTIGVLIMVHGDDTGLVLPPRVASTQVVIVPVGVNKESLKSNPDLWPSLIAKCNEHADALRAKGVRTKVDDRDDLTPGSKFNDWELRGIPIRLEVGPKDIEKNQVMSARRFMTAAAKAAKTSNKEALSVDGLADKVSAMLVKIQQDMFDEAKANRDEALVTLTKWSEVGPALAAKKLFMAPFCGDKACEGEIKKKSAEGQDVEPGAPSMGAKSLCIPFKQPTSHKADKLDCVNPDCKKKAINFTMFGRSY